MTPDAVGILRCPDCGGAFAVEDSIESGGRIESGTLRCRSCSRRVPIVRGVPRFVPEETYADSFGLQWNRFRLTQMDSHSGLPISRDRFFRQSRWSPEELEGKRVLDVGCGAGRFSEIALSAGAHVVALDYSSAVDACAANLAANERLTVIRGDIYHLPFAPETFDYVYCFGVLQHTPDPRAALLALVPPLKRGGKLAVDFYPRLLGNVLWPKYWLRFITKRMQRGRLFSMVESLVPKLLPLSNVLAAVPLLGRRLRYLVPVMNYRRVFPLTDAQHTEWAILDTFDMLAPRYDQPQRADTVRKWLGESGVRDLDVVREGLVVGRAVK